MDGGAGGGGGGGSTGTKWCSSVITTVSGATTNTLVLNSDGSGITYTVKLCSIIRSNCY